MQQLPSFVSEYADVDAYKLDHPSNIEFTGQCDYDDYIEHVTVRTVS